MKFSKRIELMENPAVAYARTVRSLHRYIGIGLIFTVWLAPLGIYLLWRGRRMYEQLTGAAAYRAAQKQALKRDKKLTPEEASLVMSWDDMSDVLAEEEAD